MFLNYLKRVSIFISMADIIRRQKQFTKLYSPLIRRRIRNARKIEIDITSQCNLKCRNCNRSCTQAPSHDQMSLEQINKFVNETVERNVKWESIMVIGGEPTLHLDVIEMLNVLIKYREKYSNSTSIILATNGVGQYVNSVLSRVPTGVTFRNTHKDVKKYEHEAFNDAPQDSISYKFADYTYGCGMSSYCGTGLTAYGYYVCPIAGGGIDRIFGFDMGRKQLPDIDDLMLEQRLVFCKLCGHFKEKTNYNENLQSPSWKKAYKKYVNSKPILTPY